MPEAITSLMILLVGPPSLVRSDPRCRTRIVAGRPGPVSRSTTSARSAWPYSDNRRSRTPGSSSPRVTVLRKSCASFINASSLSRGCASVRSIQAVDEPSKMEVTAELSGVTELVSSPSCTGARHRRLVVVQERVTADLDAVTMVQHRGCMRLQPHAVQKCPRFALLVDQRGPLIPGRQARMRPAHAGVREMNRAGAFVPPQQDVEFVGGCPQFFQFELSGRTRTFDQAQPWHGLSPVPAQIRSTFANIWQIRVHYYAVGASTRGGSIRVPNQFQLKTRRLPISGHRCSGSGRTGRFEVRGFDRLPRLHGDVSIIQ